MAPLWRRSQESGRAPFHGDIGLATDPIAAGHVITLEIEKSDCTRVSVHVELAAPCRLRIAHQSASGIHIGGPPRVAYEIAPRSLRVWCDRDALAQQIFADRVLADRLQMTIRAKGDVVELRPNSLQIKLGTARFESEFAAMHAAWRAAATIIDRLHLGKLGVMNLH